MNIKRNTLLSILGLSIVGSLCACGASPTVSHGVTTPGEKASATPTLSSTSTKSSSSKISSSKPASSKNKSSSPNPTARTKLPMHSSSAPKTRQTASSTYIPPTSTYSAPTGTPTSIRTTPRPVPTKHTTPIPHSSNPNMPTPTKPQPTPTASSGAPFPVTDPYVAPSCSHIATDTWRLSGGYYIYGSTTYHGSSLTIYRANSDLGLTVILQSPNKEQSHALSCQK